MKYTIEGLQQKILIDYGLDGIDAIILRYVIDFWHSNRMIKIMHKGEEYLWIKYQAVIEALPCIKIKNKIALSRRFKKYVDCGLMKHFHYKTGGSYSCYRFTEKYDPLILELNPFDSKVRPPFDLKVKAKDSSINLNSSIKKEEYFSIPLKYYKKYNDVTIQFRRPTEEDNKKAYLYCEKSEKPEETIRQVLEAVDYYFTEKWWFTRDKKTGKVCYSFGGFISHVGDIITWMNENKKTQEKPKKTCKICGEKYDTSISENKCMDCYRIECEKEREEFLRKQKTTGILEDEKQEKE